MAEYIDIKPDLVNVYKRVLDEQTGYYNSLIAVVIFISLLIAGLNIFTFRQIFKKDAKDITDGLIKKNKKSFNKKL